MNKTLERELNCALFERLGKKIIATHRKRALPLLYSLFLDHLTSAD